jgi:hypothetical protein
MKKERYIFKTTQIFYTSFEVDFANKRFVHKTFKNKHKSELARDILKACKQAAQKRIMLQNNYYKCIP